ncbi:MAG: hypothetical protein JWN85_2165 [Gammaproteobacteria bacterium]|nr:hypothetical protein [Gammaproteobacteria bacterium]
MTTPADPELSWEEFVEQLKPLGERLLKRVPERLRRDPRSVQESYRLLLYGLARSLSDAVVGDRRHPMFVPEISLAQNIFQPNSDTVYKTAMIEGSGTYRIRGERGTTRLFILAQLGPDTIRTGQHSAALKQYDFDTLNLDAEGRFDVIISRARPAGYDGDWWELDQRAEKFMVRTVGCRWGDEREPRYGIDRLDVPPSKGRPSAADLAFRLSEIPTITGNCACTFPDHVEKLRQDGYINRLKVFDVSQMSGLNRQHYYEGAYELADDEALIVAAKVPDNVKYWSLILTNDLYETTDWANNQASLNDTQAHVDSDGWFRAVVAARDPGVPNWLDTAGYSSGAIQGRWFDASSAPIPQVRKVKVGGIRSELPADTPEFTPAQRDVAIRERRIKAQMRVIW